MALFSWLRPKPIIKHVYTVDPQMGQRQLDAIRKHTATKHYKVGDSIESVAYRQGQVDQLRFIETQIFRGKL